MRPPDRTGTAGLTLIEVVVALAVAGAVVAAAHALFGVVADAVSRVPTLAEASDRDRNAERVLRQLMAQVEVGTDSSRLFTGNASGARFTSWCAAPGGWSERCAIELRLEPAGDSVRLVAGWGGRVLELLRGAGDGRLLYLASAENGGRWLSQWGEALTAPLAVLAIVGTDTLLLRIGERG